MKVALAIATAFAVLAMSVAAPTPEAEGVNWMLIAAGSRTWSNYRHQADAAHAHKIAKAHGIDDAHIVAMHYDDVANNPENKMPGKLINRPNGTDVYAGMPKDYTGESATAKNFISVLTGDEEAVKGVGSGRVIKSGPNDRVFVAFFDHGAPGIVCMPAKGGCDELTSKALVDAINQMHANSQYKEMVLYIEACESGSMFENLRDDINVYALTAANAHESSYAAYFDEYLGVYLGDLFSVSWMENVDSENVNTETLESQYKAVKQRTTQSHVMQFGQLSIDSEDVSAFIGSASSMASPNARGPMITDAVDSRDVELHHRLYAVKNARSEAEQKRAQALVDEEMQRRDSVSALFERIVSNLVTEKDELARTMTAVVSPRNFDCYTEAIHAFQKECFPLDAYALKHLNSFVNVCDGGRFGESALVGAIKFECQNL